MKPHTKLYMEYFGYDTSDFIGCEVCGALAVDIHHIEARGMGGTSKKEDIDNLMALCRKHHEMFGDKKEHKDFLKTVHKNTIDTINNIKF